MDEKGCQRGGGKKGCCRRYLYNWEQRARYKHHSGNLELITIIEAICADETDLKPGFVFSGSSFSPEWFDNDPDIVYNFVFNLWFSELTDCIDFSVAMSPNGWTDDFIGAEWFKKSFIP